LPQGDLPVRQELATVEYAISPVQLPAAVTRSTPPQKPNALAALVNDIGIPTIAVRASAIRQHVLEMPAPVVADALSYHQETTAGLAAQAGGTFSRYAPGDHERPSSGEGDS
jgi:hypothetical protein